MAEEETFDKLLDYFEDKEKRKNELDAMEKQTREGIEKSWNDCIYYFAEFFKGYSSYIQDCFQFNEKPTWGTTSVLLSSVTAMRKKLKELDTSLEKMEQALNKRMEYYRFPSRFPKKA